MKGLEALSYLDDIAHGRKMRLDPHELKLIVEKELKALEIIKKKEIIIHVLLLNFKRFDFPLGYNSLVDTKYQITQKEYDLLKEVLL